MAAEGAPRVRVHLVNVSECNGGDLQMVAAAALGLERRLGPLALRLNGRPIDDVRRLVIDSPPTSGLQRILERWRRSLMRRLRAPARLIRRGDLVLDANGYRHGGIWPQAHLDRDLELAATVARAKARLVLLPKSYGPFDAASGPRFARLVAGSALAYARDAESLRLAAPWTTALRARPDFTIEAAALDEIGDPGADVLLVPNTKLVERGLFPDCPAYADFLDSVARSPGLAGQRVAVLFHDAGDRERLAPLLAERGLGCHFFGNPLHTKAAIGRARLVIASRYHGMIGALTQGVPCLVIGWTHKYAGFLDHYGLREALLVAAPTLAALAEREQWLAEPGNRAAVEAALAAGNRHLAAEAAALWDEIAALARPG